MMWRAPSFSTYLLGLEMGRGARVAVAARRDVGKHGGVPVYHGLLQQRCQ